MNFASRHVYPPQPFYSLRMFSRWTIFLVFAAIATIGILSQTYTSNTFRRSSKVTARYLSPNELMKRPITESLQTIPKLFHQSWSSTDLPAKFEGWSATCRNQHSDWEWVLWTDEDNEELVRRHFPWLLKTYQDLPGTIYRADLVRNLYMYMFGGVYADLDVECLRPVDQLFDTYNVSTVPHLNPRPHSSGSLHTSGRKAFFGRMGTDPGFSNSIPNAWMASTPGHPFFLLVSQSVQDSMMSGSRNGPEDLTGPARLYKTLKEYFTTEKYKGEKLDSHVASNPTATQFTPRKGLDHSIEVLPFNYIFPYSWERDGEAVREICWATKDTFSAERCKLLLATDHWPSYAITYWSHTWTGEGHDEGNLNAISIPEGTKEGEGS
ncbi:nucleotide-diphospho-sugar transferase [Exophiala viscosa]|uniref:nucleotide-diphospho-sugar transferase n=1 Tax=Exophiala viscosa TaxID=2486360 RepID=UPI0021902293|nr:nucleotide-diphospho-sugar transferase [Exophiala viscosa]